MIVTAVIDDCFEYAETSTQVEALITRVMTEQRPGNPWTNMDVGDQASFLLGDREYTDEDLFEQWDPHGEIQIAVNRETGFGTLQWNYRSVSHNPDPPWDPRVIGDPGYPRWYHPRYAIPLARVEEAIREFCRTEGRRPSCIEWVEHGGDHEQLYLDAEEYRAMFRHAA